MTEQSWRIEVPEIAARLGVSPNTALGFLHAGRIPSVKVGERHVVHRAEFERWLEHGSEPKPLTTEQIAEAAYEGTRRALAEYVPTVRFEPSPIRIVDSAKARRA